MTALVLALLLSSPAPAPTPAPVVDVSLARLEAELRRLAPPAGGTVGVTAIHLESGRRVWLRPDERFPMASTYKVPLAVQLLYRVDRGEIGLEDRLELEAADLHPGSGLLTELFKAPGAALSIRNLLELTLRESDNSATDKLMAKAGGAAAVTARMRALGLEGIDVNRPTVDLIADWVGLEERPASATPEAWEKALDAVPADRKAAAAARFDADPRDTSTPRAMAALLERIYKKDALSRASSELLLDIMLRCRTGALRLKGYLPGDTPLAHKTGTIGGTTNDVGILTLPDGAGHVVVVVFVKGSDKEMSEREKVIAQIGRSVYDFFLFVH